MSEGKSVLEMVKKRFANAKTAPAEADKEAAPLNEHKPKPMHRGASSSRVEITRAAYPEKG